MSYTSYPAPSHSQKSPRPVRTPQRQQGYSSQTAREHYTVPSGPNWVHSSGSARPIRFDFGKALDEDVAREDETCGSSQEYYARKAQAPKPPPVRVPQPTYVTDTRYLYPSQRTNLAFNFNRTTRSDLDNMNTALPFGRPPSQPERKIVTRKDIDKDYWNSQVHIMHIGTLTLHAIRYADHILVSGVVRTPYLNRASDLGCGGGNIISTVVYPAADGSEANVTMRVCGHADVSSSLQPTQSLSNQTCQTFAAPAHTTTFFESGDCTCRLTHASLPASTLDVSFSWLVGKNWINFLSRIR
ncbi:hypothetical protein BU17DRAFT_63459 [Hysterangium stoloniferum]|nr:hypothetical protein BU17DRAFT_63459 [Hysterangium stoloniferum]